MHLLYDLIYFLGLLLLSPVWIVSLLLSGKWRSDWNGRFGGAPRIDREPGQRVILIHAVSVGEINAIRQLVAKLDQPAIGPDGKEHRPWRIVICTTTNTGTQRARELFEPRYTVVRYPLDFSFAVARFFNAVKPDLVALVELEVWPNFVRLAHRRGIKVAVVNGRLTERSFKRYMQFRAVVASAFEKLAAASVQTGEYAHRFTAMGVAVERVVVNDSMKWDTATVIADGVDPVAAMPGSAELAVAMGLDRHRPIIVAGSTAPGEEAMILERFLKRPALATTQLVLVPRKPERFDEVAALYPGIVRRTQNPDGKARPIDDSRVFLLDTIGELRKAYALCDVALVGRSFLGLYGSDPTESTGLGKPTIIGTHHKDFAEMIEAFVDANAIEVSNDPVDVAATLLSDRQRALMLGRNARRVILSRQGATDRNAELLRRLMDDAPPSKVRETA